MPAPARQRRVAISALAPEASRPRGERRVAGCDTRCRLVQRFWDGGRTVEQINADNGGVGGTEAMQTNIDLRRKIVSIKYSDVMPPRIVAWRPVLGCAQLPIGATEEAIAHCRRSPLMSSSRSGCSRLADGRSEGDGTAVESEAEGARCDRRTRLRWHHVRWTHVGHHRRQGRQDRR